HDPGAGVLEQGVDVERPGGGEVLTDRVGRLRVRSTGRRLRTTAHDIPCFRYVRLTTGTGTGVGTGSGSGTGTGAGAGSGAATAGSVRRVPRAEEAGPGPPPPGIPAQVVPAYPTAALMTRPARADSGPVGTGRPGPCPPRTAGVRAGAGRGRPGRRAVPSPARTARRTPPPGRAGGPPAARRAHRAAPRRGRRTTVTAQGKNAGPSPRVPGPPPPAPSAGPCSR